MARWKLPSHVEVRPFTTHMKYLITADIHAGFPNKLYNSLWGLNVIKRYADEHSIEVVWILGDLFHDRVSASWEVLNTIFTFFENAKSQEWICFPGNHDTFLRNSWRINSLKPLKKVISIIEDIKAIEIGDKRFFILPFVQYESAYMEILQRLNEKASENDILMTHIGIADSIKNVCFLLKNWSLVTFKDTVFKRVFTGHFHVMQEVGTAYYPGSPIPFRFDDESPKHGFLVYDDESNEVKEIDIYEAADELEITQRKPENFITITEDDFDQSDLSGNNVRVVLTKEYTSQELSEMRNLLLSKEAKQVFWLNKAENEPIEDKAETKELLQTTDLFKSWVGHDKPKDLDIEFLMTIHGQVAQEAEEIISRTEADDIDAD